MQWDELETEWRKRARGRRKERTVVLGLAAIVIAGLGAVAWRYFLT